MGALHKSALNVSTLQGWFNIELTKISCRGILSHLRGALILNWVPKKISCRGILSHLRGALILNWVPKKISCRGILSHLRGALILNWVPTKISRCPHLIKGALILNWVPTKVIKDVYVSTFSGIPYENVLDVSWEFTF